MKCDVIVCDNLFCDYLFSEIKHIKCVQEIMWSARRRRKFYCQNKEETVNDLLEQAAWRVFITATGRHLTLLFLINCC